VEIEFEKFREALTRQMPDNPTAVTHLSILWGRVLREPLGHGLKQVDGQAGGMDEMLEVIPRITAWRPTPFRALCANASQRWEELGALIRLRRSPEAMSWFVVLLKNKTKRKLCRVVQTWNI
jgi:hypothetical protein